MAATETSIQRKFGQRLREVRKQKGTSQEKLAADAGVSRTYVSDIERGARNVSLTTVEGLAAALGVTMAELMPDWPNSTAAESP